MNNYFKHEKYCDFAKRILKSIEIAILLMGLMSMVYTKAEEFPYTSTKAYKKYIKGQEELVILKYTIYDKDGNEIAKSGETNSDGEPSINSVGVNSQTADKFYQIFLYFSQVVFSISKYFSVIVTIAGAIIFPLKNYIGKNEKSGKIILSWIIK